MEWGLKLTVEGRMMERFGKAWYPYDLTLKGLMGSMTVPHSRPEARCHVQGMDLFLVPSPGHHRSHQSIPGAWELDEALGRCCALCPLCES